MEIIAKEFTEVSLATCKTGDCVVIDGLLYIVTNEIDYDANKTGCLDLREGTIDFYSRDYLVVKVRAEVVITEGAHLLD